MIPFSADLLNFYEKLKASYWFLPAVMVVGAIILAFLMPAFDRYYGETFLQKIEWFYLNRPEGARAVLSTIAGSMITVASVTFSMTITAVAFATGQIGPRLINNFMRDRTNQLTLGTFIATFMYSLLILRTIVSAGEADQSLEVVEAFVPHFSILISMGLTMASVAVLIMYIHHIPESINISNIIANVGRALVADINNAFPEELDQKLDGRSKAKQPYVADNTHNDGKAIKSQTTGYIQVLDETALKNLATQNDLRIRLEYRPGDFTISGVTLMYIAPEAKVTEEITNKVLTCFAFGQERTQTQDILLLSDELVEIIGRALSPGTNDPFTAISAMDWLHCALAKLSTRETPGPYYYDKNEKLRVIVKSMNFEHFTDAIFNKILPYVSTDRNAAMHAMKILGELIFFVQNDEAKEALLKHAKLLKNSCLEALRLTADKENIVTRYETILECQKYPAKRHDYYDSIGWLGGSA